MISFPQDLLLEDEHVLLRPLQSGDLEFLAPFAETEPGIWTYSAVSAAGREGLINYIELSLHERDLKKVYPIFIFDKEAGAYAVRSRFYDIRTAFATTQLGYTWYGQEFRRTGLIRRCKMLMLVFAFEIWGMERMEFRADLRNNRSVEAMKKIGCIVEGVLRSYMPLAEGRRDSIVLSILKKEWFDSVKKDLEGKIRR